MSIVSRDWPRIEARPRVVPQPSPSATERADVFRAALDIYIADYERHLATLVPERTRRERRLRRSLLVRLAGRLWS